MGPASMALLSTVLLAVHLLALNVASAGPLVCVWLHFRGRRGDATALAAGRRLAWSAVAVLLAGVAIGALLLALACVDADRGYRDALARFPTRALADAGGEAVFSLACLVVYAGMWDRWRGRPWLHGLWAVVSATNLLYHFPPLMVALGTLAVRPELVPDPAITRDVFRPLMVRPEILAQSLHFTLASLAASGLALMIIAGRLRRCCGRSPDRAKRFAGSGDPRTTAAADSAAGVENAGRLIRGGAAIALAASLLQLVVGTWVLAELPLRVRQALIGDDWLASGLFFVAIVGTFGLLHSLASVGLGNTTDRSVLRCAALLVGVVVLMTGVLETARNAERKNEVPGIWATAESH